MFFFFPALLCCFVKPFFFPLILIYRSSLTIFFPVIRLKYLIPNYWFKNICNYYLIMEFLLIQSSKNTRTGQGIEKLEGMNLKLSSHFKCVCFCNSNLFFKFFLLESILYCASKKLKTFL